MQMVGDTVAPRPGRRGWAALTYVLLVGAPILVLVVVLLVGPETQAPPPASVTEVAARTVQPVPFNLLRLLTQVALIVAAARLVGKAFRRLQQPQVVGEMAAGLLLGPSLLGAVAPGVYAAIFPAGSLDFLQALSQVGLLVFMFLVGLELDLGLLRGKGRAAMTISHTSIAVPFALGTVLALWLYPKVSSSDVSFAGFALFVGTAMSVTAFPVLARILTERGILRTRVGAITLASAAVDDVSAWSILAAVVLLVRSSHATVPIWLTVAGTLAFVGVMIGIVRPALRRWVGADRESRLTHDRLAMALVLVLVCAMTTEWLGIHALFGAFLAGAIMPRTGELAHGLVAQLEDVTVVLLLPLFFAFTGLRTRVDLLNDAGAWLIFGAVLAVAVAGKLGGSTIAARLTGMSWREAGIIGALMNTRGLMELVVLNLGLDIGVISPRLFTAMVLMALTTTFMTTPLLALLGDPATRRGRGTVRSGAVPSQA